MAGVTQVTPYPGFKVINTDTSEPLCFFPIFLDVERCQEEKSSSKNPHKGTGDKAVLHAPETPLQWGHVPGLDGIGDLGREQGCINLE